MGATGRVGFRRHQADWCCRSDTTVFTHDKIAERGGQRRRAKKLLWKFAAFDIITPYMYPILEFRRATVRCLQVEGFTPRQVWCARQGKDM